MVPLPDDPRQERNPSVPSIRIAAGSTAPGQGWQQEGNGVSLTVDTSSGGFTATPVYTSSLAVDSGVWWFIAGNSNVQAPTATEFKVYIQRIDNVKLNVADVVNNKWYVNWHGIQN